MNINLLSFNARGLADNNKRRSTFNWINKHQKGPFDIILLQETHSSLLNEAEFKTTWNNYKPNDCTFLAHGTQASRGVMTIVSST